MPYSKDEYPDSMKNLNPELREKAIEILNALIDNGKMNKGMAIATATKKAKEWAEEKGLPIENDEEDEGGKDLHVKSHEDGWAIEEEDADEAKQVFDKKEYAIERARELARKNHASLIIHKADGEVQEKRDY